MSDETPKPSGTEPNEPPVPSAPPPPRNTKSPLPTLPPPSGAPVEPPPPPGSQIPLTASAVERPYRVGDAFSFGWAKFQETTGTWLLAVIIAAVIFMLVGLITGALQTLIFNISAGGLRIDPDTGGYTISGDAGGLSAGIAIMGADALQQFTVLLLVAQFTRAALEVVRNGTVRINAFVTFRGFGAITVGALILAALYFLLSLIGMFGILGLIVSFIGTLLVPFFGQFYVYFILDDARTASESISGSLAFVNRNLVKVIMLSLASFLALLIGAALCFVGLLVAIPVMVMAHAYTYRSLNGKSIAAWSGS